MDIYRCELCGNIVTKVVSGAGPLSCCGQPMTILKAGVVDAAVEKHVPSLQLDGDVLSVQIGEVVHPMQPEHYIQMILVQQENKVQYVTLSPEQKPNASFVIDPSKPVAVYEYCNLHGLWRADLA